MLVGVRLVAASHDLGLCHCAEQFRFRFREIARAPFGRLCQCLLVFCICAVPCVEETCRSEVLQKKRESVMLSVENGMSPLTCVKKAWWKSCHSEECVKGILYPL